MEHTSPSIAIRPFARSDLTEALEIQALAYPAFLVESETSFASRLDAAMSYCLTAHREGKLAGYVLAHGWQRHAPPEVGVPLPDQGSGETLFIHDLAIAPVGRGQGIGRKLIACAFDLAKGDGLMSAELVAVEGAANFWRGMGFAELQPTLEIAAKLAGYGREARWMGRSLG